MGFRVLLIAIHGKGMDAVHREYGVEATNQYVEMPDAPVMGASLPSGGYLLYINDLFEPDDSVFASLSKEASLLACSVNETVMCSQASEWRDGTRTWAVCHDAQDSVMHLAVDGVPPELFWAIRETLSARQNGVDDTDYIFDIPVELFVACGGLRYDHDIEGAPPAPWQVLKRTTAPRRKRWFWPFG